MYILKWMFLLVIFWSSILGFPIDKLSIICIIITLYESKKLGILIPDLRFNFKILHYFIWLIKEIIVSSLQVTKHIWSFNINLISKYKDIEFKNLSEEKLVILANSITITPGTLVISQKDNSLLVHALDYNNFPEDDFIMYKKVKNL